jgi:endonuclease III-like uncharacterized protein
VLSKTWKRQQSENEQVQEALENIDNKVSNVLNKLDGRTEDELQELTKAAIKQKMESIE